MDGESLHLDAPNSSGRPRGCEITAYRIYAATHSRPYQARKKQSLYYNFELRERRNSWRPSGISYQVWSGRGATVYTLAAAEKLRVSGFVRNLGDGRVEVFAVGTPQQHRELRSMLERGPRFSSVSEVREEPAISEAQDRAGFFIDHSH
jgi:acylphosphatase